MAKSESAIQDGLYFHYIKDMGLMVPNVITYQWESDLLRITPLGLVFEYEIKTSVADFKNDFKNKEEKHSALATGRAKTRAGNIPILRPNFFYYVCRYGLISISDIPDYAGLIWFSRSVGYVYHIKRRAPKLHSDKIDDTRLRNIIKKFYYKYWNLRTRSKNAD